MIRHIVNHIVNKTEENKGVIVVGILSRCTPSPLFCVSAGMIGLTGAFRGCTGIVRLSRQKSEGETKGEGVGRSEMAQEQRPLSMAGGA